jgi:hypothetical protein
MLFSSLFVSCSIALCFQCIGIWCEEKLWFSFNYQGYLGPKVFNEPEVEILDSHICEYEYCGLLGCNNV